MSSSNKSDLYNNSSGLYSKLINKMQPYLHILSPYVGSFKNICGIYVLWVFIHYLSTHLYIHFCTPKTIVGFLMSPFMAAAPHCQALRWGIYNGGNSIVSMWLTMGVWLVGYITPITYFTNNDKKVEEQ